MAKSKMNRKLRIIPYLFIGPAVIYLTIVTVIPVIMALPISFTDWSALSPKMNYIGFANYKRLFGDKEFYHSLVVMAQFLISVPLVMLAGLAQALLLNNKIKGMTFFRVVYYSPVITSTIAAAVLFDWFYQPTFGLFNSILGTFGMQGIGWITDAKTAVMSVTLFRIWKTAGSAMLIYLAGLQDVPEELIEASDMDGATRWQKFTHITWPLLKPAHMYLLVTGIIGVFMIFQETYMFVNTAPLKSLNSVVNYIYDKGFTSAEMGYASAMSFVLFAIIFVITLIQFKFSKTSIE